MTGQVPPTADLAEQIAEPTTEQANMMLAFAAVQAARHETFLAHYPRKLKLAVTALLLFLLTTPFWAFAPDASPVSQPSHEQTDLSLPDLSVSHDEGGEQEAHVAASGKQQTGEAVPARVSVFKSDVEREAAAANDAQGAAQSLSAAPDPALTEQAATGQLPRISNDGRKPWQVYARPFDHRDPRPRVVLVMGDLGLSRVATDAALRRLPLPVTLAFDGQAEALKEWVDRARQDGHEALLSIPMEPSDYPRSDPGADSLLTILPTSDNLYRLLTFLQQATGYVGITTFTGTRFATEPVKISPIVDVLRQRGLLFFDARISTHSAFQTIAREMNVPVATATRMIDAQPTPTSIDEALSQLEQTARVEGTAIGIASPLPLTLERIELWAKGLADRGLVLAPLSAVVK